MNLKAHLWLGVAAAALAGAPGAAQTAGSPSVGSPDPAAPGAAASAASPNGASVGITAEAANPETNGFGDIVVTARRREEALQSVPVAITALTASQLEQKGVRAVEDLRNFSPSLNVGGQRRDEANFYLRGQTPGVIQAGQRNFTSVATYFAQVPALIVGPGSFYDLANVQVLKGPQGTLFGRNTTGGAILFEPARPTQEIEGYVQATYGNYNYHQADFMVNAPIVPDVVALRVAGQVSRRDGYTKSINTGQRLDGRKYDAIRGSLLLTPGSSFENLTIVDYRAGDNSGTSEILRQVNVAAPLGSVATPASLAALLGLPAGTSVNIPIRAGGAVNVDCLSGTFAGCPTGPFGGAVAGFQAAYNRGNTALGVGGLGLVGTYAQLNGAVATQQAIGPRRTQVDFRTRKKQLNMGFTNQTKVDLSDSITLRNIVAFRKSRKNESTDYDGTPLVTITQLNNNDQEWAEGQEQFTEEFQIQGRIDPANLSYILGYYHEFSKPGFAQKLASQQFSRAASGFSVRFPFNKDQSDAIFGHAEWQPVPLIGLSGGVRQTWDKREASVSQFNNVGACTLSPAVCPISGKAKFDKLTYDGTLNVKPMDRVLVYAAYRFGYKSGGFNLPTPSPDFLVFQPETVKDIEIGAKADFDVGIPLRVNVAAYRDKYKNVQTSTPTLVNGRITSLVQNVGRQTNKGVEVEASIIPVRGFTLSGFYSYSSAQSDIDLLSPTGAPVAIKGRQIPNSPREKYGVSGVYSTPFGGGDGELSLSADYSWQAKQNTPDPLAALNSYSSYGQLNARIEWRNAIRSGIDLAVFGTNVTNKTYILGGFPLATQLGFESVIYGEPRMYGGSIRYRWGGR